MHAATQSFVRDEATLHLRTCWLLSVTVPGPMKRLFLVLGTVSGLSSKARSHYDGCMVPHISAPDIGQGRELPPDPAKVALPAVPAVRNASDLRVLWMQC